MADGGFLNEGEGATVVVASYDVSPSGPVTLGGFATRAAAGGASSEVETSLEAGCLLLRHQDQCIALITLDLLYASDLEIAVADALRVRAPDLADQLTALVIAASHTHSAPMIDAAKPKLGAVAEDYRAFLVERLADALATMLATPGQPARFRSGLVEAGQAVNRRLIERSADGSSKVAMAPNPAGPLDRELTVGIIEDAEGRDLTVLWAYACHPVCQPRPDLISADFPGHARNALRAALGRDLPVLYFQGFSGDVRPHVPPGKAQLVRDPAARKRFHKLTPERWKAWTGQVSASLIQAYGKAKAGTPRDLDPFAVSVGEPLSAFVSGESAGVVSIRAVRLTARDILLGASAEISSEYSLALKAAHPELNLFLAGCVGDTYGYLATATQMAEGGYEADRFVSTFSLKGAMRPDCDPRFRAMAKHALRSVRQPPAPVTHDRLVEDLRRLGLTAGDTILARASMRTVNADSDVLIDAVLDVIGPEGTLAILAFTPIHPLKKLQSQDVFTATTPPTTGGFTQKLLDRPGAIRSTHPTNSWVALGPKAHDLLNTHGPDEPAFEPIRRLIRMDGKFAVFGCVDTCPGFSTIHLIEYLQGQSEASPVSGQRGIHYLEDGVRKTYVRKDVPGCSRGYWQAYRDYFDDGVLKDGYVGNGYSFLMPAIDAYRIEAGLMNRDPAYALCEDCTCPKRNVAETAALRLAPALDRVWAALPNIDYNGLTFADVLSALAPILAAAPPAAIAVTSSPPLSMRDCAEAAVRFSWGGHRDIAAILDARIAAAEYGDDRHLDLLAWMVNSAPADVITVDFMEQLLSGLPPGVMVRFRRAAEIPWLAAYNRIRKLERDPLNRTKTREVYKSFMRANMAGLRDGVAWRTLLAPFVLGARQ